MFYLKNENRVKFKCIFFILCSFKSKKEKKQNKKKTAHTAKKICTVFGDGAVAVSNFHWGFAMFRNGNFDLEGRKCFCRSEVVNDKLIETLIKNNPGDTARNIVEILESI